MQSITTEGGTRTTDEIAQISYPSHTLFATPPRPRTLTARRPSSGRLADLLHKGRRERRTTPPLHQVGTYKDLGGRDISQRVVSGANIQHSNTCGEA